MSKTSDGRDNNLDADDDRKTTPGYVVLANTCGIAGVMLAGILAFYYALVGAGHLPPPIMGVIPMWTTAIILLGGVKMAQWAADCAVDRILSAINKRYATLLSHAERVSDEALERAHESGQWKGMATAYRHEESGGVTSQVVPFGRRGNNNAN